MKHTFIYIAIASLALATGACTDDTDSGWKQETEGTPLAIRAGLRSGETGDDDDAYKAFAKDKQIHVYYAYNNLDDTYDFLQGIYQMPEGDKTANWTAKEWTPEGGEQMMSIYMEDIKKPNSNGRYYFTATSYPEPRLKEAGYVYEVPTDQAALTAGFEQYDFLAARAIYSDNNWKTEGITLHFRHLLCQLRVQLILPEGSMNDGYFPNPKTASIQANLVNRYRKYRVNYSNATETKGIFDTSTTGTPDDLKMHSDGVSDQAIMLNGRKAWCHTFSVILPKQSLAKEKLISFTIDGKPYSYIPPEANTVLLEQEKITTIQLTVLSGAGKQKVILNKVTLEDWKTDKSDVGDLIPQ